MVNPNAPHPFEAAGHRATQAVIASLERMRVLRLDPANRSATFRGVLSYEELDEIVSHASRGEIVP